MFRQVMHRWCTIGAQTPILLYLAVLRPRKATVAQDPKTMAIDIIKGVVQILNGETIPRTVEVPGVVITRDNIPMDAIPADASPSPSPAS